MRCEMEGWRRREKWSERLVASLLRAAKAMAAAAGRSRDGGRAGARRRGGRRQVRSRGEERV
jgi:hypothetical protein